MTVDQPDTPLAETHHLLFVQVVLHILTVALAMDGKGQGVTLLELFQHIQLVDVAGVQDDVQALEHIGDATGQHGAQRRDMGIADDANLHDSPLFFQSAM